MAGIQLPLDCTRIAYSAASDTRRRNGTTRILILVATGVMFAVLTGGTQAGEFKRQRSQTPSGSSKRAFRQQAIKNLPIQDLTPQAQRKIGSVVSGASVYRRVPSVTIQCDANLEVFLLRNPHVVIDIWKLMGITGLEMQRKGEFSFDSSDGMGTTCNIDLVYSRPELHLYYGRGTYDGKLSPNPINGECVVMIQCRFGKHLDGTPLITNHMDVFLRLDGAALDFLARTFHPLFGKSVDTNYLETAKFLQRLSATAQRNPAGMLGLARSLDDLEPATRDQFSQISMNVGERYELRSAQLARVSEQSTQPAGPDQETQSLSDTRQLRPAPARSARRKPAMSPPVDGSR